jgi:hypothetical protein
MNMTEVETHKARKAHRCEWCWQRIDEGAEYKRYRYYDGGEAGTVKMHPECYEAMQEAAREEGGWIEWTPGMERPLPANDRVEGRDAASSRRVPSHDGLGGNGDEGTDK